jgi:hypothetical protein
MDPTRAADACEDLGALRQVFNATIPMLPEARVEEGAGGGSVI